MKCGKISLEKCTIQEKQAVLPILIVSLWLPDDEEVV